MAKNPEEERSVKAFGYAARDTSGVLSPFNFSRRATGEKDVQFKVLYCGICHTDLHFIKNEWGVTRYPMVPGHEIVGVVTEVGTKVEKFKVGDKVGVGYMVGSCRKCASCDNDLENYCPGQIPTANGTNSDGTVTYGGYSDIMVSNEHFVVHWPDNLPIEAAPLLCAGITTYSPLKYFGLDKPGMHIGVVGLGGLGHMAVKFAKAFGAKVTVISTSIGKKDEALQHLGADLFVLSSQPQEIQGALNTMDGIIDTVSADHPLLPLLGMLKPHGKLVMVGAYVKPLQLPVFPLILGSHIIFLSFLRPWLSLFYPIRRGSTGNSLSVLSGRGKARLHITLPRPHLVGIYWVVVVVVEEKSVALHLARVHTCSNLDHQ